MNALALPPGASQEDYRDAHPAGRGLSLRVSKKRKTWSFLYRWRGREKRFSFGTYPEIDLASARERVRELRVMVDRGEDPMALRAPKDAPEAQTVADLIESYAEDMALRDRSDGSIKDLRDVCRLHVTPRIGRLEVEAVTEADIRDVLAPLEAKGQRQTRNKTLTHLRTLFRFAGVSPEPTTRLRKLPTPPKDIVFSADQLRTLLCELQRPENGMAPLTALAILMAAATLKRGGEITRMRFDQIDLEQRIWTIRREDMKARRPEAVPLSAFALDLLERSRDSAIRPLTEAQQIYVFPSPRDPSQPMTRHGLTRAMARLLERTGIKQTGESLHCLRDTGTTWLAKRGVPPHVFGGLLHHSAQSGALSSVTARYQHYDFLEERRKALEQWGDYLESKYQVACP